MIKRAAAVGANWLCKNGVVERGKDKIYAYGLELLLSGVFNTLCIISLSAVFFRLSSGVFFLLAFIPLRSTAGGYHANSHFGCNLVCLTAFVGLQGVSNMLPQQHTAVFYLAAAMLSLVTLLWLSPCEAGNKALTPERHARNRRRSLLLGGANLTITIVLLVVGRSGSWVASYYLGVFAATLSMWATQIMKKECVK